MHNFDTHKYKKCWWRLNVKCIVYICIYMYIFESCLWNTIYKPQEKLTATYTISIIRIKWIKLFHVQMPHWSHIDRSKYQNTTGYVTVASGYCRVSNYIRTREILTVHPVTDPGREFHDGCAGAWKSELVPSGSAVATDTVCCRLR